MAVLRCEYCGTPRLDPESIRVGAWKLPQWRKWTCDCAGREYHETTGYCEYCGVMRPPLPDDVLAKENKELRANFAEAVRYLRQAIKDLHWLGVAAEVPDEGCGCQNCTILRFLDNTAAPIAAGTEEETSS